MPANLAFSERFDPLIVGYVYSPILAAEKNFWSIYFEPNSPR